jgi:hypothetical protein
MRAFLVLGVLASCFAVGAARADYPSTILADNPAAYYRLDEAGGPTASDISGNGNNGMYIDNGAGSIMYGQPGAIVGDPDTAVCFTGGNGTANTGYVSVDNVPFPVVDGNDFSLEFWVMTTSPGRPGNQGYEGYGLVWCDIPGTANDWSSGYVQTLQGIDFVNVVSFTSGNPDTFVQSQTDISDGVWHHIVCVRTLGVDTRMYVDGQLEGVGTTNSNTLMGTNVVGIGGNPLDNRYFPGCMDEVALYNYALTADQVAAHYLAGLGLGCN